MSDTIEGKVVEIDSAGNAITDITIGSLKGVPTDHRVWIACEGHRTNSIFEEDHGEPEMTFLALIDSGGNLNLVLVGDSAHRFLGIGVGDRVVVEVRSEE